MAEQTALTSWLDEWTALIADARQLAGRLARLELSAAAPATAADARLLFAFRDRAGLDGPATAAEIADTSDAASRPFADLVYAAGRTARALLGTGERALPALAREGVGVVSGVDLPQSAWFVLGEAGERRLIGVRLRDLPDGHPLRTVLPAAECYQAAGRIPAVILGPALAAEGDRGYLYRPRRWYAIHEISGWTRAAEERRRAEAESQRAVSAALEARQRAHEEAQRRADPQRRLAVVEAELEALRGRGA